MNKHAYIWLLLAFLAQGAMGKNIVVPSPAAKTIRQAVQTAAPFDTVQVCSGRYDEGEIVVDKPLTIVGIQYPVVNGMASANVFYVRSRNVSIAGLEIIHSGRSSVRDYAGIKIEKAAGCIVKDNRIVDCYFGVYLLGSDSCLVSGNEITGNGVSESSCGNAIHLWKCRNAEINNNTTGRHRDGMYFEFAENCRIRENTSEQNLRYGLHFMFSNGNVYEGNVFRKNGSGVAVMYTENVEMKGNVFEDNWGVASYGLLLKDITRSRITGNRFLRNTVGIYMEGSGSLMVSGNLFESNGWGMKMLGNCVKDSVVNNDFLSNTFDVVTNSFISGEGNIVQHNFWDRYEGYDLNKDRKGDIPFRPVSLFSVYVEKIPDSVVLLRSFLIDLLDSIERAIPSITPDALTDEEPLMNRNL